MNKYKAAGYLRISKEEKEQTNSLANQKQIINNYIKKKKDLQLVDYYIDAGNYIENIFKTLKVRFISSTTLE